MITVLKFALVIGGIVAIVLGSILNSGLLVLSGFLALGVWAIWGASSSSWGSISSTGHRPPDDDGGWD